MIKSYTDLNDKHIDFIREIGNIGAGNAATSFGLMTGKDVKISVPKVIVEDIEDVMLSVGGPDGMSVSVFVKFSGDASGIMLFVMSVKDADSIIKLLAPDSDTAGDGLSEFEISCVSELGNIIASSYLSNVADLTGMHLRLDSPRVEVEKTGVLLAAPLAEYGASGGKVMLIENSFSTHDEHFIAHVIMFTGVQELGRMMRSMGFEF
jgi:chemotaxis protein CheC